MAKRRTRKQKERARHEFTVSWQPEKSHIDTEIKTEVKEEKRPSVKRESSFRSLLETSKIKKDIVKSLFLAGLIIGIEIILYFTWQK